MKAPLNATFFHYTYLVHIHIWGTLFFRLILNYFKPKYAINILSVIWSLQRSWFMNSFINPREHWSMTSDVRAQSTQKSALLEKRQSDSKNPEKTNLLWKTYSRLPDFDLTVIIMGKIEFCYYEWTVTMICSLFENIYISYMSDFYLTDETTQIPLPLSPPPTLSSLQTSLSPHWSILLNE